MGKLFFLSQFFYRKAYKIHPSSAILSTRPSWTLKFCGAIIIKTNSKVWETWPFWSKASITGGEPSIHLKVILPSLFLGFVCSEGWQGLCADLKWVFSFPWKLFCTEQNHAQNENSDQTNPSNITSKFSFMACKRKGKNHKFVSMQCHLWCFH